MLNGKAVLGLGVLGIALSIYTEKQEVLRSLRQEPPYLLEGPLVSVIVPALEEQQYLPNLLSSLANQTYTPIQVIVVDQSSPEAHAQTRDICLQYAATLLYSPLPNISRARNEGAQAASGQYLVFSDADNILAPACIEHLARALDEGYVLANPVQCLYDDAGLFALGVLWGRNWFKGSHYTTCCVGIRRDAYFEIGGYEETCDPFYGCREDLQLGQRILEHFGPNSAKLVRNALVGTSARRLKKQGTQQWTARIIRSGEAQYAG